MVDRKVLDERGVFVSDMAEIDERLNEIHSTLRLMIDRADGGDDHDLLFGLQGAARSLLSVKRDLFDVEQVLTDRGAILEAEEYMRRKREEDAAAAAKAAEAAQKVQGRDEALFKLRANAAIKAMRAVDAKIAAKVARRSRKAVRK